MNTSRLTLAEAAQRYKVERLEPKHLEGQEKAFEHCMEFLEGLEHTKHINPRRDSYGLKHVVENPAVRFNLPEQPGAYACYIYEGTFILASLASGFLMRQAPKRLSSVFNIPERSLKRRAKEISDLRCKAFRAA
jgi:hypothetical protein